MSIWADRFKRFAIVIAIFALVIIGVKIIRRNFFQKPAAIARLPVMRPGDKISLPDIDWAASEQTLLLCLNKDCGFCNASAPFYRRLIQEINDPGKIRFVAVLPHPVEESQEFLNRIGIPLHEIRKADFGFWVSAGLQL